MNELLRETLGQVWRVLSQMEFCAENGHVETLKAQYLCLQKQMKKLELIQEQVG